MACLGIDDATRAHPQTRCPSPRLASLRTLLLLQPTFPSSSSTAASPLPPCACDNAGPTRSLPSVEACKVVALYQVGVSWRASPLGPSPVFLSLWKWRVNEYVAPRSKAGDAWSSGRHSVCRSVHTERECVQEQMPLAPAVWARALLALTLPLSVCANKTLAEHVSRACVCVCVCVRVLHRCRGHG